MTMIDEKPFKCHCGCQDLVEVREKVYSIPVAFISAGSASNEENANEVKEDDYFLRYECASCNQSYEGDDDDSISLDSNDE